MMPSVMLWQFLALLLWLYCKVCDTALCTKLPIGADILYSLTDFCKWCLIVYPRGSCTAALRDPVMCKSFLRWKVPLQGLTGGTREGTDGDQLLSLSALCLFLYATWVQMHFIKWNNFQLNENLQAGWSPKAMPAPGTAFLLSFNS